MKANLLETGSETLTILRRSSSRRKRSMQSGASGGAAGSTSSPIDDMALEQVDLENLAPLPSLPSTEACENASLR